MVFDPSNLTKSQFESHLSLLEDALAKDLQYPVKKKGKLRNVLARVLFNAQNGYQQVQHLFCSAPDTDPDNVDYKALLYKYVASVYETEGIDYISRCDPSLTSEENDALIKASNSVGQGSEEAPTPQKVSRSTLKDLGGHKLLASAKAPSDALAEDLVANPFHSIIEYLSCDGFPLREYFVVLDGDSAAFRGQGEESATLIPKDALSGIRATINSILSQGKETNQPLVPGNYEAGAAVGGYRSRVIVKVYDEGGVLLSVRPLVKA